MASLRILSLPGFQSEWTVGTNVVAVVGFCLFVLFAVVGGVALHFTDKTVFKMF